MLKKTTYHWKSRLSYFMLRTKVNVYQIKGYNKTLIKVPACLLLPCKALDPCTL